jgi:hypothetical protein
MLLGGGKKLAGPGDGIGLPPRADRSAKTARLAAGRINHGKEFGSAPFDSDGVVRTDVLADAARGTETRPDDGLNILRFFGTGH